jgi:hypothetical protein
MVMAWESLPHHAPPGVQGDAPAREARNNTSNSRPGSSRRHKDFVRLPSDASQGSVSTVHTAGTVGTMNTSAESIRTVGTERSSSVGPPAARHEDTSHGRSERGTARARHSATTREHRRARSRSRSRSRAGNRDLHSTSPRCTPDHRGSGTPSPTLRRDRVRRGSPERASSALTAPQRRLLELVRTPTPPPPSPSPPPPLQDAAPPPSPASTMVSGASVATGRVDLDEVEARQSGGLRWEDHAGAERGPPGVLSAATSALLAGASAMLGIQVPSQRERGGHRTPRQVRVNMTVDVCGCMGRAVVGGRARACA